MPKIRLVCATRVAAHEFRTATALGRSLALYPFPFVELVLHAQNTRGLPAVYNEAIRASAADPALLVFLHDDLHLLDFFWPDRLVAGLRSSAVVGLAGCRRRYPGQMTWRQDGRNALLPAADLSGAIAHGKGWPADSVSYYGPPGVETKLMDGVLLAAHGQTLLKHGVSFDERFTFHFYDLDFCRTCEAKGLRMATVPLPAVHESGGNFATEAWQDGLRLYREKWPA